jgi:hypothetical protein
MAMLDRYRKTGGFNQLLNLLETCGPSKQEKFLELIRAEDPKWADMILTKMLDINRIYGWNQETLAEIIGALQDLTIVVLLHGASDQIRARINSCFTHSQQRKIDALYSEHSPSPLDVTAAHVKVIETVRRMVHTGSLRFDKFDTSLTIEDGIEETLTRMGSYQTSAIPTDLSAKDARHLNVVKPNQGTEKTETAKQESGKGISAADCRMDEINALKQRLVDLSKENAALRHELSMIKSKLDQIKRIA